MKKPTLTCTTPHGTFRRGTYRKYTHLVVLIHPEGHGTAVSWHSSLALALQGKTTTRMEMARWKPDASTVEIFPVDPMEVA